MRGIYIGTEKDEKLPQIIYEKWACPFCNKITFHHKEAEEIAGCVHYTGTGTEEEWFQIADFPSETK